MGKREKENEWNLGECWLLNITSPNPVIPKDKTRSNQLHIITTSHEYSTINGILN